MNPNSNSSQSASYAAAGVDVTAGYEAVSRMFSEKYPAVPTVFTLAPVCRPSWLVEMECLAITGASNPAFRAF